MLVDWTIYGVLTWCLVAVLNAFLFKKLPASRATAWVMTIAFFVVSLVAMTALQHLRYEAISDNLGFTIKPRAPLDTIGAFTFAWLFFGLLRKQPTAKSNQVAPASAARSLAPSSPLNKGSSPNGSTSLARTTPMPSRSTLVSDEDLWAIAAEEVDGPARRKGLWAKAFAEAQGNETAAKVSYLKWRVEQLQFESTRRHPDEESQQREPSLQALDDEAPLAGARTVPVSGSSPDPALVEAVWKGNWNTASTLLAQGRSAAGVDTEGRTLVDLATIRDDKPMIELLRRYIASS